MRKSIVGLWLLGACTFGVDGDFAATEAGLVSVESMWLDSEDASPIEVSSTTNDGLDVVVAFEVGGVPGELRIRDVETMLSHGGTGTIRTRTGESWSVARTVRLSIASETNIDLWDGSTRPTREISIDVGQPRELKAQQAGSDDSARSPDHEEPEDPGSSSNYEEPTGSLVLIVVEDGHC